MKTKKLNQSGFSLIEIIVTVAVIGIMVAMALPLVNAHKVKMQEAKNKRNAQSVATIYKAAQVASLEFCQSPVDELETVVKRVAAGDIVPTGVFAGEFFGIKAITEEEALATLPYLDFDPTARIMVYRASS